MIVKGKAFDEVQDLVGVRVIVSSVKDCYGALGSIHALWAPVQGRFKDYIAMPKFNLYQSLHTTVVGAHGKPVEVQIRTHEMNRRAEHGIAAHWGYKERSQAEDLAWLQRMVDWQQDTDDPTEFMHTLKVDLEQDEVFVFTPKGEVINLSKGATPIDFAYAIHTKVGEHCSGAKVNGKLMPLRHHLADGDTVEIITSPAQYPRKDWLEFVASARARSKIRHALRAREKERGRELGREILDRDLRKAGLSLPRLLESGGLDEIARSEAKGQVDELFALVGYGKLASADVVQKLRGETAPAPVPEAPRRRSLFRRAPRRSSSGIRVNGQPDVLVRFPRCCAPLPGDDVIGFVTRGRGVTVHQRDCAKTFEQDPARRIDVQWDTDSTAPWSIRVRVHSLDRPGLLAKVTKTISAAGVNIGAAQVSTTEDAKAVQTFDLWVNDVATLNAMMKEIGRIKGVLSVARLRT
jgi:GTP pyrophosphokinase